MLDAAFRAWLDVWWRRGPPSASCEPYSTGSLMPCLVCLQAMLLPTVLLSYLLFALIRLAWTLFCVQSCCLIDGCKQCKRLDFLCTHLFCSCSRAYSYSADAAQEVYAVPIIACLCIQHFKGLGMQGWKIFEGHVAEEERGDLVAAYHKRLTSPDTAVRDAAVCFSLHCHAFSKHSTYCHPSACSS